MLFVVFSFSLCSCCLLFFFACSFVTVYNQSVPIFQLSFSSAFRSVPRWSNGVDWKSPATLTLSEGSPPWDRYKHFPTAPPNRASIRILLESAIRNCDNFQVTKEDVEKIIDWENTSPKQVEIPFKLARVLLQDFTGVPALVDLACMRDAMNKLGSDSNKINPLRSENVVQANMELEFQRNKERFAFLKWGSDAFQNMLVVPPGFGIVHQINLEYLGCFVFNTDGMLYPDSVVGTDSHTTMIDGLGVTGWGVGGIEAEAAMLGQVFELSGKLCDGVTATDLVLTVTQMLRKHGVVGKFVEFYGEGVGKISLADRATIGNMSPEYGGTMGFFPVDHVALQYLKLTGRSEETVAMIEAYLRANNMFVDYNEPQQERVYSSYLHLDLADVEPCISGPKRPHDRVPLKEMKADWHSCLDNKVGFNGFAIPKEVQNKVLQKRREMLSRAPIFASYICLNDNFPRRVMDKNKSCTRNRSSEESSLEPGNATLSEGDLDESVASAISENDIVVATVLSGNRNFKGRVHPLTRANYLASPPLVAAYALAGTATCVGLAIRNRTSGMTSIAHMDSPNIVDVGLTQMLTLVVNQNSDAELDVHLIGGFEDASPQCASDGTRAERKAKLEGYSFPLCAKIAETLQKSRGKFHLQTLHVLGHNTRWDSKGNACPIFQF
ncbi:unnamed protein product [Camellia sinensis]